MRIFLYNPSQNYKKNNLCAYNEVTLWFNKHGKTCIQMNKYNNKIPKEYCIEI